MEVGSKCSYPGNKLSNFAVNKFVFDGVEINSLEGILQSLKFDKVHIQNEVCKLTGLAAKRRGYPRSNHWRSKQTLWWRNNVYRRDSEEYQNLLTRIYDACFEQSESFRRALKATGNAVLTHGMGGKNISDTILTEREFIGQLHRLRKRLHEFE